QAHAASDRWPEDGIVGGKQIRAWGGAAATGHRSSTQRVLEREVAVDPGFEVGARDGHLELVPAVALEHPPPFGTALDRSADAIVELPQDDVVLGVVITDGEPIAVWFDVEENARTAIQVAGYRLEVHADRAVAEVVDAFENGDWVVGKLFRVVHQLFVRRAVKPP